MVIKDPDKPDRRVVLPVKSNIAPDNKGLAYTVELVEREHLPEEERIKERNLIGKIQWEPKPIEGSADDFLEKETKGMSGGGGPKDYVPPELVELCRVFLADAEGRKFDVIKKHVKENIGMCSDASIRKALKRIGATSVRKGYQQGSEWRIADISGIVPQAPA